MPDETAEPRAEGTPTPRYCRRCGAVLEAPGAACPSCRPARRPRRRSLAGSAAPIKAALWLYFLLLGSFVFLAVRDSVAMELVVGGVDALIVLGFSIASWRRVRPLLGPPDPPVSLLWAAGLAVGTFAFATAIIDGANALIGLEGLELGEPILEEGFGWAVVVWSVCIQPAVVEEFAFRGVILGALDSVLSRKEATVVSAVLFAVLHLSPIAAPHLVAMGILLAWLRWKTGSIWPCVVLHGLHNALVLATE